MTLCTSVLNLHYSEDKLKDYHLYFFFLPDFSLSLLFQHLRYLAVVSHPLHASPYPIGQSSGQPHGQVPLVRGAVSLPVLSPLPTVSPRPLHRGVAGLGGGWSAPVGLCDHCDRSERHAETLPAFPALIPPQLGLPAQTVALLQTLGQSGYRQHDLLQDSLLLLLQVLQR